MRGISLLVVIFTIFCTCYTKAVQAQVTLIPDPNFEQALINLGLDTGPVDGSVPKANISTITFLDVANRNISNLTGIQDFVSLTRLFCNTNNLSSINISKNTALTALFCDRNKLTSLDVSKNTALTSLLCTNNRLTSLDVTNNILLKNFGCDDNQLTSLDVTRNTELFSFGCGNNFLTSLDVTKNTALASFGCEKNLIADLDVTKNPVLTAFGCGDNLLTDLDITKNPTLYSLECYNNLLTNLDVTKNPILTILDCAGNQLSNIDISKNPALTFIRCMNNQLVNLDLAKNIALTNLWCYNNLLTSLDLSKNITLVDIKCNNNQLVCLNLKNGFNGNITSMMTLNNLNLACIQVDDAAMATGYSGWFKDAVAQYSNYCSPTIGSFSPASTCSGGVVSISGCNLSSATSVSFGGVAASSFTINSSTNITAIVGIGASGSIEVKSPGGTATIAGFVLSQLSSPASLSIAASANDICPGTAVIFTASPANTGTMASFQWKLNGINVAGNNIAYTAGSFANGDKINCVMNTIKSCPTTTFVNSDTIVMIVKPVPAIAIKPTNPSISFGNSVQLNAAITGSAISYFWTPAVGLNNTTILNPVAGPATTTSYNLHVTSANNCTSDKEVTVTVYKTIYIPNSFSPNGDGMNDIFRIPPGIVFDLQSLIIYNRYGNEIFKTTDITKGWDGAYKGFTAPAGAYSYIIKGTDVKGKILLKGSIILIR